MESLQELRKQKDKAIMSIFWLSFSLALVFGIPAAIGALVGTYLDKRFGTGSTITTLVLVGTMILSWIVVVRWYRNAKRRLADLSEKIRQAEALEQDTSTVTK